MMKKKTSLLEIPAFIKTEDGSIVVNPELNKLVLDQMHLFFEESEKELMIRFSNLNESVGTLYDCLSKHEDADCEELIKNADEIEANIEDVKFYCDSFLDSLEKVQSYVEVKDSEGDQDAR